jgi:cobyric acid synthase
VATGYHFHCEKEKNYDRLADVVRQHLRMDVLRRIMGGDNA